MEDRHFAPASSQIAEKTTYLVGGWAQPLLKNDGVKVSWDDDIPNIYGKIKNVPNHQPVIYICICICICICIYRYCIYVYIIHMLQICKRLEPADALQPYHKCGCFVVGQNLGSLVHSHVRQLTCEQCWEPCVPLYWLVENKITRSWIVIFP